MKGETKDADSNYHIGLIHAKQAKNDTLQIFMLNNLGLLYQDYGTLEQTLQFYRSALKIAKKINNGREIADTYNNIGTIYMYYEMNDSSVIYYEKGIDAYKITGIKPKDAELGKADISTNIANIFYKQGKYILAFNNYFISLKIYEKHEEWPKAALVSNNIADMYIDKGDFKKAEKYARLSTGYQKKMPVITVKAQNHFNLGKIMQAQRKYDSADFHYKEAEKIYSELGYTHHLGSVYNSMGAFQNQTGDFNEAIRFFKKALDLNISTNDTSGICVNYFNLSNNYIKLKNINEAKKLNDLARSILRPGMYYSLYIDIYGQAADIYSTIGNFKEAYLFLQERNLYRDSLTTETNMRQQEELEKIYQTEKKDKDLALQKSLNEKQSLELEHAEKEKEVQRYQIQLMMLGGLILFIFIFIVIRSNIIRKKNNKILEEKNSLISQQKQEVELKNLIIEEKQKEITDSINYAKRIQFSLLAQEESMKKNLNDYFVLFKPKDIVSGDFYWSVETSDGSFYIAACDCTGHGVPGAFMSLLNISFLNEAVSEKHLNEPGKILDFVRDRLIKNMEGGKDGMDAVLMKFQTENFKSKIQYAAAHNRPIIIRKGEIIELETDKMPVGKGEKMIPFRSFEFSLEKDDMIYLCTDGYSDQFGGPKGKKLKSSNLHKCFIEISSLPLHEQKQKLDYEFEKWRGELEQVDDVCIIGVRI